MEQFDELATRDQWVVAYPDGLYHRWNDGRNDATSRSSAERVDDVLLISTLIDHLKELYSIDTNRVFATGMSNGGMMTERLGCELSDKIAAIAAVAGSLPQALADATPARPFAAADFQVRRVHPGHPRADPRRESGPRSV